MDTYTHSVSLEKNKCTGCTTCIKHCPTEAIRIRDGIAVINSYRCIDCGQCIRICPHQAKKSNYDKFDKDAVSNLNKFKIALPAPTLYGQFENLGDASFVIQGLLDIGFDDVFEVAKGAEVVSAYTRRYMKLDRIKKPVISSACPVALRLISLRFPTLREHVLPLLPPMDVAAKMAKKKALKEHPELSLDDIKVFFISPCPAKVSYVRNGYGGYKSEVDEVVSISDIYFRLLSVMKRDNPPNVSSESGRIGISWASSGGESTALLNDKFLAADGVENIIRVLDQIENGNFPMLDFIELNACPGGCVGGVMAVENPYVAKARLRALRKYLPVSLYSPENEDEKFVPPDFILDAIPEYRSINKLSDSLSESMRMMSEIQVVLESLPGIDCGACGSPSCQAFAEDCVKGESGIEDCLIKYSLERLAKEKAEEQ